MSRIEELYPLTPMQLGVLSDCLAADDSGRYLLQLDFSFQGDLDEEVFEDAWRRVIEHYPILRTSIHWEDLDEPVQVVRALSDWRICREDWRSYSAFEIDHRLAELLEKDRQRGIDLAQSPLMRLCLIRTAERSRRLIWSFHHIILEGWSASLVLNAVQSSYRALSKGALPSFAPSPRYRDFVAWTKRRDQGIADRYWAPRLSEATPTDLPRIADSSAHPQGAASKTSKILLSTEVTEQLRGLARTEGLTLNTVVQGAWALALGQYGTSDDVLFGAISAGRSIPLEGIESLVGVTITVVPVRLSIDYGEGLIPWLKKAQADMFEALRHGHVPLRKFREWTNSSDLGTPFHSLFVFENWSGDHTSHDWSDELSSERLGSDEGESGFPLTLEVGPDPQLLLNLRYDPHRYAEHLAKGVVERVRAILVEMASRPERSLGEITALRGEELQKELSFCSGPQSTIEPTTIHGLFEQQVQSNPDAIALSSQDGDISYAQLNRAATNWAAALLERGVGSESAVAICVTRSPRFVVAILAVLKAGGCYVPLDPEYPVERLQFIVEDCCAELLLTERGLVDTLSVGEAEIVVWEDLDTQAEAKRELSPHGDISASQAAYILYTSGSTGPPKGVVVEHQSVVALIEWSLDNFDRRELSRMLLSTSFCFDLSVFELFVPLSCGGRAVLVQNALALGEASWASTISFVNTVPSALRALLDTQRIPTSALVVGCAGERLPTELANRAFQETNTTRVVDFYGPTEDTVYSTSIDRREFGIESIGQPIANTRAYILDQRMQLAPTGAAGSLYLAGAGLARGYLARPDITADGFLPDPYSNVPGARMYKTGDRARRFGDGTIEFLGRADRQVKFRGFRLELQEIESALLDIPTIAEAAVEIEVVPPGTQSLVSYVASPTEPRPTERALKQALRLKLPSYMVPSSISVFDALPRTPSGKLDRSRLLDVAVGSVPDSDDRLDGAIDELEQQLVGVWKKVLGVPVGRRSDFFELGGNSLAGIRLLTEVERATARKLPLATLFQAPTIEQMAVALRDEGWVPPWTSLAPIQPRGTRPPFYCVHGLGGNVMFYRQLAVALGTDQPFYGIQAIGLDGATPPLTTVEAMADHYVNEIRSFQPDGPYYLGGFCFGAYVALEIAHRLRAGGQEVALLASIDTDGGWRQVSSAGQSLKFHLGNLSRLGWKRRAEYLYQRLWHRGHRISNSLMDMIAGGLEANGRTLPQKLLETRMWETHLAASRSYRPAVYPGRLTYYQSSLDRERDSSYWTGIVTGGVEVHLIPTQESDLLSPPAVNLLAQALRASIDATLVSRD